MAIEAEAAAECESDAERAATAAAALLRDARAAEAAGEQAERARQVAEQALHRAVALLCDADADRAAIDRAGRPFLDAAFGYALARPGRRDAVQPARHLVARLSPPGLLLASLDAAVAAATQGGAPPGRQATVLACELWDSLIAQRLGDMLVANAETANAAASALHLLPSLPSRIGNALRDWLPARLQPEAFYDAVAESIAAVASDGDLAAPALDYLARMSDRVAMAGGAGALARRYAERLVGVNLGGGGNAQERAAGRLARLLLTRTSALDAMLMGAIDCCGRRLGSRRGADVVYGLVGEMLAADSQGSQGPPGDRAHAARVAHLVAHEWFVSGRLSRVTAPLLARVLALADRNSGAVSRAPLLPSTLRQVAAVWSDPTTTRHATYPRHLQLTMGLTACLGQLAGDARSVVASEVLVLLLPGIQIHLDSALAERRVLGMVVAECFAEAAAAKGGAAVQQEGGEDTAAENRPLKFGYEEDDTTRLLVQLSHGWLAPASHSSPTPPDSMRAPRSARQTGDTVPAANASRPRFAIVGDAPHPPLDLGANDPRPALRIPEDAPPPRPLYLVDCLKGLQAHDEPDRFAVCLQDCEQLVRGLPDDLDEYAEQLARTLVFVSGDEPAGVEDTSRASHAALVACAACAGRRVLPLLAREALADSYSLGQRAAMLSAIRDAAAELRSGGPRPHVGRATPLISVVESTSAPRRAERSAQNNFALLAADVFHPLMDAFDARLAREGPAKRFSPLAHDAVMLADFVATLAAIVEAAGSASPFAMSMARALWDAVWPLRTHERAEVRRAVLSTFRVLLSTAAASVVASEFLDEAADVGSWARNVWAEDSDSGCRALALAVMEAAAAVVRSAPGW